MPDPKPDLELADELLALPTRDQQTALLRDTGLLKAEGLDRLLDEADRLLNDDPGKARKLAELCAEIADAADAPAAVPRATYIRAGVHFINGGFDKDLHLTKAAYDEYIVLGMNLEALRTNVGRIGSLLELGRYQEALDVSQAVLDTLNGEGKLKVTPTQHQADLLVALVHQNRGRCFEYMGRYEEALGAYAGAEKRYRDLGMVERLGEIIDNRGAILSSLGWGTEALAAQESAAIIFYEANLSLAHTKTLVNIGETHLRLGNYTRSLEAFEGARRPLQSLGDPADRYLLLRHTADAYLELNLYSESLVTYQEAVVLLRGAGMAHDLAQALWGQGAVLAAMSEFEKAERALSEAADLFAAAGNTPQLSGVMLEQASIQEIRGDTEGALRTACQALDSVSEHDWPVQQVYAHLRLVDLLLPNVDTAEQHLLEARRLADPLNLPQLRYRLDERLGRLRLLQGRDEEARVLLEAAVERIERLRGTVAQENMRASFLRDKTAAYEDLLRLHLARGEDNPWQAFAVAERAKSRALVDLLTGVVEKGFTATEHPELEERLQHLQADLNATYSRMLGASEDGDAVPALQDLHDRATGLEAEIGRLRLQTAADPFAIPTATPEGFLKQLPPDVTLLAYHVVGDEILAFVIAGGQVRVVRHLSTTVKIRELLERLSVQWDRVQASREFADRHAVLLERSARQVLSALYEELVAPLEPLLEEADLTTVGNEPAHKLVVVPHGLLHQAPFHALFDGERYLLERFEVSYAPSAAVYALCQERTTHDPESALVVGVSDPLIPAAADEAHAVASCFLEAGMLVGEKATVAALRDRASRHGALHLACHGMFRADNPMFSSLKLHDGWLMAVDAMDLDLDGALVTLSACESGRSAVIGGDEILGLARAFLGAGAATLVVSQWLVQDASTAELMESWYRRLRDGEERTAALRAAQLEIKERYPHPYYWAPFVLIGKR